MTERSQVQSNGKLLGEETKQLQSNGMNESRKVEGGKKRKG